MLSCDVSVEKVIDNRRPSLLHRLAPTPTESGLVGLRDVVSDRSIHIPGKQRKSVKSAVTYPLISVADYGDYIRGRLSPQQQCRSCDE